MRARHPAVRGLAVLLLCGGAWAGGAPPTSGRQEAAPLTVEGTVAGFGTHSLLVRDGRGLVIPLGVDEDTRLEGARMLEDLPMGQPVVVQVAPKSRGNLALAVRAGPAEGVGGGGIPQEARPEQPPQGQLPILREGRGAGDIRSLGNDLGGTGTGQRGF
jgi:hypothetical protein